MARIELVEWGGEPTWRCSDCGHWCRGRKKDNRISHHPHCDLRHTQSVKYPDASGPLAATFDPLAPQETAKGRTRIRQHAREGTLYRDHSDEEIQRAVTAHEISVSDAMNQDM